MSVSVDPPKQANSPTIADVLDIARNADLYQARLDELAAAEAELDAKLARVVDLEALRERERVAAETIAGATAARDRYVAALDRMRAAALGDLDEVVARSRDAAMADRLH